MPIVTAPLSHSEKNLPLAGVTAALLIPRDHSANINWPAFEHQIRFLRARGIKGFAINGATGEYTLTTPADLRCLLRKTRQIAGQECTIVAGVGAASVSRCNELCDVAVQEGADGVLLPMPYFFPYGQDDLAAFVHAVASEIEMPVYLYNLPSFTTPLEPATTLELIEQNPSVIGIKDSSGSLDTLSLLKAKAPTAGRILGNDSALHAALAADVCDGVVSGVACVLPELMLQLYQECSTNPQSSIALALKATLEEFITWLDRFPVPWGLKIIAEARGLDKATFPLPLSAEKEQHRKDFTAWFETQRDLQDIALGSIG